MDIQVARYRKPGGFETRFWSVTVDGELLAVTVYRRGAEAVARAIDTLTRRTHVTTLEDPSEPVAGPSDAAAGLASVVP